MTQDRQATRVLERGVLMQSVDPLGLIRLLEAVLSFDPSDPYAVTLTFHTRHGDVPWIFARDLLERGVAEPVGDGDVTVRPGLDSAGHAMVVVELRAHSVVFTASVRTPDVLEFLAESHSLVPSGAETESVDMDAVVDRLLVGS